MLGRKTTTSRALTERMRKITEALPAKTTGPADPLSGKRAIRTPSFRPGTLTFMNNDRLDCIVTNVSGTGAEVQFVRNSLLPERVMLIEPMSGVKKWAYVSWQTWGVAGLEFVGARRR